jgi:hypothetical protein
VHMEAENRGLTRKGSSTKRLPPRATRSSLGRLGSRHWTPGSKVGEVTAEGREEL